MLLGNVAIWIACGFFLLWSLIAVWITYLIIKSGRSESYLNDSFEKHKKASSYYWTDLK